MPPLLALRYVWHYRASFELQIAIYQEAVVATVVHPLLPILVPIMEALFYVRSHVFHLVFYTFWFSFHFLFLPVYCIRCRIWCCVWCYCIWSCVWSCVWSCGYKLVQPLTLFVFIACYRCFNWKWQPGTWVWKWTIGCIGAKTPRSKTTNAWRCGQCAFTFHGRCSRAVLCLKWCARRWLVRQTLWTLWTV